MIQISSTDSSILVKATEGEYIYPSAKTELELPLNSVILTLDESEMAVFRSAANFDVLFTAVIDNLQIDGASVTKDNIADKFADAATSEQGGFKYEVVDELPSEGEKGTIYLVPNAEGTHTEYLYVENVGWEQVGTAEVDLSDYYTKEEVDEGNRVNAAAFNVLQKSIGLNENLETIDGKSIQAQIDELKEGGSGEQNYFIVDSLDEVENPKEGTYATVKSRDALIEKGAWDDLYKKSVYIIPNTTGKTFTVNSNNGLEITLMYDGSALSLVESEDPTLFDYGEKKTIDGVEYFIVDVKPTDDTIAFVGWDEEEGGEFSIYVMGTIPTKLYKYNGTEWKEAFYDKVDGIEIAEYTDNSQYTAQAGILTYTDEEGKWSPEFYLASDEDWSSNIHMYVGDSDSGIEIRTTDGSNVNMYVNGDPTISTSKADGGNVNIHSDRLEGYSSEGVHYDIKYSDILTKDDFIKTPNLTLFGAVNVNEGQISDFNASNYAQFPFLVNLNTPFEIKITVTLGDDITNQHNIIDSDKGLAIAVRNRQFVVAMSSDGQTWDMGEHIGRISWNANRTYHLRLSWDGSSYKLAVNPNGSYEGGYLTEFEFNSSTSLFPTQIIVGKAVNNSNYFNGSINLNECSLSINGNKVWEGMDDLGLSTRLATDLSNIDANGESVINDMIDSKIGEINTLLENLIG